MEGAQGRVLVPPPSTHACLIHSLKKAEKKLTRGGYLVLLDRMLGNHEAIIHLILSCDTCDSILNA